MLSFTGCVRHTSAKPYYTGSVTNVFFDRSGHYLGSNGQMLWDLSQKPLPSGAPHQFGAAIGLGYKLKTGAFSTSLLIEATVYPCDAPDLASCGGQAQSFLTWLDTVPAATGTTESIRPRETCAYPRETQHDGPDPDPSDGLFRLYGEGLMRVSDDVGATIPRTHLGLVACLRLVPNPSHANDEPQDYVASATAYFFDTGGRLLGLANQGPLAVGGQQLGIVAAPNPRDLQGIAYVDGKAGFHDFGVTVDAPRQDRASIDRHVVVALTVQRLGGDDRSSHTYYRVIDACAPDLPDPPEPAAQPNRLNCRDFLARP